MYYRYYGASLAEIDPLQVIREAFQLIYPLNLRLPTRFVLLDKAIATLGSVGVELYPDFNVFEVAKPYAREPDARALHAAAACSTRARTEGLELARIAREHAVPGARRPRAGARRPDRGRLRAQGARRVHAASSTSRSTGSSIALVVVGGLIGSSLIGIFATTGPQVLGLNVLSFIGFVLSGVLGLWLLWGVVRSGRL